jgi:transposase
MDNMRVHHSRVSKEAYKELKLTPIFNIAYSPQFNPIESVFSMIKSNYKKQLLKNLIEKHKVQTRHSDKSCNLRPRHRQNKKLH